MIPKVSVLVPCYNVQKYLPQCLDSLINQTLKEIEIIAINDGSTDDTLRILQEYAARDGRIIIINKPNEGYGKSMNRGLKKACGKYIGIVESDDWADTNMFKELYELAEKHNVQAVKSAFYNYAHGKSKKQDFLAETELNRILNPKKNSAVFYYQPSIWSAIYKRSFLEEYQIDFLESPGASYQDVGFNFKVWAMAERVWLTPSAFIHYRNDNAGSSVNSAGKVFCVCDEWANIDKFLTRYPDLKKASRRLRNHVKMGNYFWNLKRLKGENRENFRRRFMMEYQEEFNNNGIKRDCFSSQAWLKMMKMLAPSSYKWKLFYWCQKICRPIISDTVKNGQRIWSVCFGLIPVKRVPAFPPNFMEGVD